MVLPIPTSSAIKKRRNWPDITFSNANIWWGNGMILLSIGASMDCLNTSLLILAAIALKEISESVGSFFSSDSSENGTDFTSPVDNTFISAMCLPNTDFFESISISFPW